MSEQPTVDPRGAHFWTPFTRITSSGRYVAEIDGLRFIAIAAVILFHVGITMARRDRSPGEADAVAPFLRLTAPGQFGVQLFFAISGYVLAQPFAECARTGGEISLGGYYRRRLLRIEPPFVLSCVVYYGVQLARDFAVARDAFPHFVATLGYCHNIAYGGLSPINNVTWSLEIEVQFYLLAPLLAWLVLRGPPRVRQVALGAVIVGLAAAFAVIGGQGRVPFAWSRSIVFQLPYFLVGMLLADLQTDAAAARREGRAVWDAVCVAAGAFLFVALGPDADAVSVSPNWRSMLLPPAVFLSLLGMFRGRFCVQVMRLRWIALLGGMCYTIYLYHFPLVRIAVGAAARVSTGSAALDAGVAVLASAALVTLVCALLFVLTERPFMDRRWPSKLARAVRGRAARTWG